MPLAAPLILGVRRTEALYELILWWRNYWGIINLIPLGVKIMTNQNDTILHHWFEEVWNKGRREVIDEMLSPDAIAHGLTDAKGNEVGGAEALQVIL